MTEQPKRIVTSGLLMWEHVPDGGVGNYELVGVFDNTSESNFTNADDQAATIFDKTGRVQYRIEKYAPEGIEIIETGIEDIEDGLSDD